MRGQGAGWARPPRSLKRSRLLLSRVSQPDRALHLGAGKARRPLTSSSAPASSHQPGTGHPNRYKEHEVPGVPRGPGDRTTRGRGSRGPSHWTDVPLNQSVQLFPPKSTRLCGHFSEPLWRRRVKHRETDSASHARIFSGAGLVRAFGNAAVVSFRPRVARRSDPHSTHVGFLAETLSNNVHSKGLVPPPPTHLARALTQTDVPKARSSRSPAAQPHLHQHQGQAFIYLLFLIV